MSDAYLLKLYVTGETPRAKFAIANLRRFCEAKLAGQYKIMVIDVLQQPDLAEEEGILVTPTLVKESPAPAQRIIGDLSDMDVVLFGLGIHDADD
ncbi:MAG: circadian clock KaiB family protein [Synechococcales bacterium]|nr:circadian clock KaiB family protein [Synechococcales bacterium]